jgi:hypothetical protein
MHSKELFRSGQYVRFRDFDVYFDERRADVMANEVVERSAWNLTRGAPRLIGSASLDACIVLRGNLPVRFIESPSSSAQCLA